MKKIENVSVFVVIVVFAISCNYNKQSNKDDTLTEKKTIQWKDFFPMDIGMTWTYDIKLNEPREAFLVSVTEIYHPSYKRYERGYMYLNLRGISEDSIVVKLRCINKIKPSHYYVQESAEIDILWDNASIFESDSRLFFVVYDTIEEFDFLAGWVINSKEYINSWDGGSMSVNDCGVRERFMIFSSERTGDSIWSTELPGEKVTYMYLYNDVLRYQRIARERPSKDDINPYFLTEGSQKTFTEDYYFKKDTGLIRLVQEVDGEITMEWNLTEFCME